MDDVFVRFLDLPTACKGAVRLDQNGDYNVYLNPAHGPDVLRETYAHELRHIASGDLRTEGDVDGMEVAADG